MYPPRRSTFAWDYPFLKEESEASSTSTSSSEDNRWPRLDGGSIFEAIPPPIEIDERKNYDQLYDEDLSHRKVNLASFELRSEEGLQWSIPVVRQLAPRVAKDLVVNYECVSSFGVESFRVLATQLLLGKFSSGVLECRAFGIQTVSGINAVRLGAEFLYQYLHYDTFYCSRYSSRYRPIFSHAGFTHMFEYRYWDNDVRGVNFEAMLADLECAPETSVVLLQVCGHIPLGQDLSQDQWTRLADLFTRRRLFPFFDCLSLGIATGDIDLDAWPVRYFTKERIEFFCAQSFTNIFAIYNERVGNLVVCLKEPEYACSVKNIFSLIIKSMYFNPPQFGARLVACVLCNDHKRMEWTDSIKKMAARLQRLRKSLRQRLEELHTPGSWAHITSQRGAYSILGLSPNQLEYLNTFYSIYMCQDGCFNVSAINDTNIGYISAAIHDAVVKFRLETLNSSGCEPFPSGQPESEWSLDATDKVEEHGLMGD